MLHVCRYLLAKCGCAHSIARGSNSRLECYNLCSISISKNTNSSDDTYTPVTISNDTNSPNTNSILLEKEMEDGKISDNN